MSEPTTPMRGIFFRDFQNSYIPHILREIYLDKIYTPYLKFIKDGTVLDVGMNVGLFTHFAVNAGAKFVYGVEPAADHIKTIKHMLEYNKVLNAKVLPYALSHENGETELLHSENVTAHSILPGMNNAGTTETVKTITIDKLMEQEKIEHINFLKLDPEGAEFAIIGSDGFKKVASKIDAMVVEFHSWPGINYNQPINTLRDLGFQVDKLNTEAFVIGAVRK